MYKIDDYIMYKNDVCKVVDIKDINNVNYLTLIPINDETLKIKVPADKSLKGLRKVITSKQAQEIIAEIPNITPLSNINEKYIENTYRELINTGKHEDLIKIIKTSYLRNEKRISSKKKPSEKDSKYFELAEKYLYSELGIALNMTFDQTKDYIIKTIEGK